MQSEPQAANAYAASLPDSSLKSDLVNNVVMLLASTNIPAAMDLIDKCTSGQAKIRTMQTIAFQWAVSDPKAAVAYGEALPPGNARYEFMRAISA